MGQRQLADDLQVRWPGCIDRGLPGLPLKEQAMSTMHNPPHPGETLRDDVLPALGLSVTDAAAQLGVTRAALSRVLNGRAGISPEMALRLERWLGVDNGGRAGVWLGMQAAYDLWLAQKSARATLNKIKPIKLEALAA
jgi:antitoxin HigA-1